MSNSISSFQFNIAIPDVPNPQGREADWRFAPFIIGLECLTKINQWQFRRGVAVPLEDSGVVYKEEPIGRVKGWDSEHWDDCVVVANRGWGDCDDLAPYLAAQIRELYGVHAECVLSYRFISRADMLAKGFPLHLTPTDGAFVIHVLVRLPNGNTLDPSKWLGMQGEAT